MYDWIGKMTESDRLLKWVRLLIPRPVVLIACFLISRLVLLCAGKLRARVMDNMLELMKGLGPDDVRRGTRKYFFNLCLTLYELLIDSPGAEPAKSKPRFTSEGETFLEQALSEGKGAVIFTPHTGNFFYYYWHLSQKYRCMTVATAQSKELRPIYLRFEQMGCRGLDYDITPPLQMMRKLRGHLQENGIVLLLGDFYRPNFPPSTLFGRPTRSPAGAAVLALEQHVPVIPFYGYRSDGFNHKLVFGKPLYLYEEFERHQRTEATNRLNATLEDAITQVPEQWFYWFNAEERWQPDSGRKEQTAHQDTVRLNKDTVQF